MVKSLQVQEYSYALKSILFVYHMQSFNLG